MPFLLIELPMVVNSLGITCLCLLIELPMVVSSLGIT